MIRSQHLRESLRPLAPSRTAHPAVWEWRLAASEPLLHRSMYPCRDLRLSYPENGISFEGYRFRRQTEAIFFLDRPSDVLEREGWIVERGLRLHERAQIVHQTSSHRPGLRRHLIEAGLTRPARQLKSAVSLRTRGESNYYHAINDILGSRIRLVQEYRIPPDIPFIVSPRLASQRFFPIIRRAAAVAERDIVVQEGGRIRCSELFYGQSATLNVDNIHYALDALHIPKSDPAAGKRVFIVRRPPAPRSIGNLSDVQVLLRRYGFIMVDTSDMAPEAQMELFGQAGVVIGVHGAGLLNMIFRRSAPLQVIEIFDSAGGAPPPHYMVIANRLGFGYTPVASLRYGDQAQGALTVDVDALRSTLERVLVETT